MNNNQNSELQLAFEYVQNTNVNVFLTGKAGTGKTTFLHNLRRTSHKRMIVVAPTGVAAINAGGVTIHSFFQISFGPQIPADLIQTENSALTGEETSLSEIKKFNRDKIKIIRSIDLLVIDEISMVRADLLDAIDAVLRRFRNSHIPFGGVQLLMIGDIQQLAPVVKEDEWNILKKYYDTVFFFSSKALQQTQFVTIELRQIYRQNDLVFIDILNKIRDNRIDPETLNRLNSRYKPGFNPPDSEGYIILTTHNIKAQEINNSKLEKIHSETYTFEATVEGDFPEYAFPTESRLTLKTGAQVMFVKNDLSPEKSYYNGKIGIVTGFDEEAVYVKCPDELNEIIVNRTLWENTKYTIDEETKEIKETVIGTFEQYPLKLAWAITIHKSQGLTFDRAIIDAQAAFAHGQVYVALSRCRTIEGLVLSTPISGRGIINDAAVSAFAAEAEKNAPGPEALNASKRAYRQILLNELFDFQQIQKQINHCNWLLKEHLQFVFGNIHAVFEEINNTFSKEILTVAEKFNIQLNGLMKQQDDNDAFKILQERVKKACIYFGDKLNSILLANLNKASFEADNKEIKKTINHSVDKLFQVVHIKQSCLTACKEGFDTKGYLDARAKASIESPALKHQTEKQDQWYNNGIATYPALYSRLASWRARKALESNLPVYRIVKQKTLISIVNSLPQTAKALALIKGFGKKKIIQYGNDILNIINAFCREQNIELETNTETEKHQKNIKKTNSRQISYDLWKSGQNIQQIAAERGLAISTIEGHLAYYVGTGEIEIHHLVYPDKAERIAEYFLKHGLTALTPAREALGNEFTYSELRFVLKSLEAKKIYLDKRLE
jgi:GTPase SAR1 family protein